ncbi:shikimate kinase [Arthrobacter dokdonensis]|uniref:shikimate kinase n=1 Tax=Arthrobacter dokdonellae TaxID=2211210 RepID=UPI001D130924|nr:shikimate kinase [Arthrobacter dokdonellae]
MGVCGSGKSVIGQAVAESLGRPFIDADNPHPATNKVKMAARIPFKMKTTAPGWTMLHWHPTQPETTSSWRAQHCS